MGKSYYDAQLKLKMRKKKLGAGGKKRIVMFQTDPESGTALPNRLDSDSEAANSPVRLKNDLPIVKQKTKKNSKIGRLNSDLIGSVVD